MQNDFTRLLLVSAFVTAAHCTDGETSPTDSENGLTSESASPSSVAPHSAPVVSATPGLETTAHPAAPSAPVPGGSGGTGAAGAGGAAGGLGGAPATNAPATSVSGSPAEAGSPTLPAGGNGGSGGVASSGGNGGVGPSGGNGGAGPSGGHGGAALNGGNGGAGLSGGSGPAPMSNGVFPAGVTTAKLMIVGDSISAGPGCYKRHLLQNLKDNGYRRFEFVGEYSDDCGEVRHSAVSCASAADFTKPAFAVDNCFPGKVFPGMETLTRTHQPDLLMIQLGVNDVWGGDVAVESVLGNYTTLVEQARRSKPDLVIVMAQIHRIITNNCSNGASTSKAEELVNAVPAWAAGLATSESLIFVADLWTNSDASEAEDCVHPNDAGAERMGVNWFNALKDILPKD